MELLLVIVIAAILTVFVFPIYSSFLESSKQAVSVGNIRSVSQGLLSWIYYDNGGRFPYAYIQRNQSSYPSNFDVKSLPSHYTYWAGAIFHGGYVKSVDAFFSPLQKPYWKDAAFQAAMRKSPDAWQWAMIAYGANGLYMPYSSDAQGRATTSIASVEKPAQAALLAEAAPNPSQSSNGKYDGFHAVLPGRMTYPLAVRTAKKVAVSFMDGHAELLTPDQLSWDTENEKWSSPVDKTKYPWGSP